MHETIISLFERQAKLTPDKVAVVYESLRLTYSQLNERSNQLAHCLREQYQVNRERVVGIMMERSEKMMIGILGILKAGGAYLPLDPVFPRERIEYMLKDSGAEVLVVDALSGKDLQYEGKILSVDIAVDENDRGKSINIDSINMSRDLCYLIYTSGSTGRPKGVMISHYNVVNFFHAMDERLSVSHDDSMLAVTSTSFDISVLELLWTLCSGMEVLIHPSDVSLHSLDRYLTGESRPLDFSLFFFSSYNNTDKNKYNLLLESVKYADREGFRAIWTPERHFHEFGGLYPNPAVLSSALAMITKQIGIRCGSVVSPLHDAIRIAEEWSVVDNLSNGRIGLSFASGWNINDFVLAPAGYNDRHNTMYEQIETVKKMWKGESIIRVNGAGQEVQLRIFPEPVQKELPVWVTSGGSEETFRSAGAIGANVLTHLLGQDIEDLERKIKLYRSSRKEHGYNDMDGKVAIMLHTYIGEDIEEVEKLVEGPFIEYLKSSLGLSKIMLEESGLRADEISDETKEQVLKSAFRRYYETSSLIGTKSSCEKLILKLKKMGVDEIACLVDFGIEGPKVLEGLSHLNTLKNLHLNHSAKVHKPVTMMQSTPSFIKAAMESEGSRKFFGSLRTLLVGGEPVPFSLVRELSAISNAEIYNMYGPTETTIWSCMHKLSIKEERVSVGTPILNTQVYILGKDHHLLPVGVAGEVYIGGEGVSRGYWGRPELTQERFIQNPYVEGDIIYKTGDIGKWLWNGTLELMGREDQQVKVRGYRIELGEIESRLLEFPKVREAAVTVKQGKEEGDKALVAYMVTDGSIEIQTLRRQLGESLPHYMIPGFFVKLDRLPLTPNGKLDRKALPDPEVRVENDFVAPQTREELLLADVWSLILGVEKISVTDNFFSIGGDSIKSIQIISRMRAAGYELSVKDILTSQTIKQLALRVRAVVSIADQREITGVAALTPVQQWFFEGPTRKKHHYNQSVMLNFPLGIRADLVKDIFVKIQTHHDALRMVFPLQHDGTRMMKNRPVDEEVSIREYDLTGEWGVLPLLSSYCNEIQAGGDLSSGALMRLGLFHMTDGSRLLIVIHHLIVDGISWRILFEDIKTLYLQLTNGEPLKLPHKTNAFLDWPAHLAAYTKSDAYEKAVQFWELQSEKAVRPIPRDFEDDKGPLQSNHIEKFRLSENSTTNLLTRAHERFGTGINDLLLTALLLSVRRQYHIPAMMVDMEGHGREEIPGGFDFSRTIGWFTSIYPVVLQSNKDELSGIIKEVKETIRRIPNNGIDFGIRKYLDKSAPKIKNAAPSRIIFNYLGQFDADLQGEVYAIAKEMHGDERDEEDVREYDWEFLSLVTMGELEMRLIYNECHYHPETIRRLMHTYKEELERVIAWCIAGGKKEFTPSDLTYKSLPAEWLDKLQDRYSLEDVYPLSPMQEGILFHSLLDEKGTEYFQQINCFIRGALQIRAVEQCMNDIIARHVVLRTAFIDEYERPLQVALSERKIDFLFKDCRADCESGGSEAVISRWQEQDRSRRFDLGKDVLIRLTVLQTGNEEHEFIFSYHHVVMDGWCMGLIMSEFMELYGGYLTGRPVTLPAVAPFSAYVSWLEDRNREESASYWRRYLSGYRKLATVAHPADVHQTGTPGNAAERLVLSRSLTSEVQELSVRYGVTINTIVQTAWGILLSKYNDICDVVFGSVVTVRPLEVHGIETMVGLFINTIPVRVQWNEKDKVSDVLRNMQEAALDAEPYYYHSLPEIQTFSSLGRNLLDHILIFENYPLSKAIKNSEAKELELSVVEVEAVEQTNYGLTVEISPGDELSIDFKYLTHIFGKQDVQRIACHLNNIFQQMVAEEDLSVAAIETVTAAEKRELLHFQEKVISPPERSFIQLFEEQVMQTPDGCAVVDEQRKINYRELNDRSEAFAGLIAGMPDAGGIIALYAEPSIDMVAGILAILKAGRAFLLLDPTVPAEHRQRILQASKASVMLTKQPIRETLDFEGKVIMLDQKPQDRSTNTSTTFVSPGAIACVSYSLDDTGQPEGVLIKHSKLVGYVDWIKEMMPVGILDRAILTSSFAFNTVYASMFPILAGGGTLHAVPASLYESPQELLQYVSANSITFLKITPGFLQSIIGALSFGSCPLSELKWVMLGGEPIVSSDVVKAAKAYEHLRFITYYAPVETTIPVIAQKMDEYRSYKRRQVIGRPIYNTGISILDRHQKPVPIGIPGELCVDGMSTNGHLFRTGDVARWLPDGTIEIPEGVKGGGMALAEPATTVVTRHKSVPRTKEERLLVEAWSQLLGREKTQLGLDDDFFELGGHSLVAIRLCSLIRQRLSVDLAMRQIFKNPSIRKLARLLTSPQKHPTRRIQKVEKREYYPVSSAQERLFYEHLLNKDIPVYNTCNAFRIEGELDVDRLEKSFQSLVKRHEGLRTGFMLTAGGVVQVVNDIARCSLIDMDETKYITIKEAFDDFVEPFDLSAKTLMRCGLLRHRTGNILFVDIHHIVCDGVSKNTLVNDFMSIYNGTPMEALELRYVDYAYWQRNQNGDLREQKEFWIRALGDRTIKADLPMVHNNKPEELHCAAYEVFQPADAVVAGITELAKTSGASVFMILLSVYYLLLSKVSGSTDIVIGSEGIGRPLDELGNVVGSFVNILPMRMQVRRDFSFMEFLAEVKECVLQAFENQDFQYDQIVSAMREIDEGYGNLIDAHFSFANTGYSKVEQGALRFIPIDGLWTEKTDYVLSLQVAEEDNKLYLHFIYSTGCFDQETIQLLLGHYKSILSDVLQQALYGEYEPQGTYHLPN